MLWNIKNIHNTHTHTPTTHAEGKRCACEQLLSELEFQSEIVAHAPKWYRTHRAMDSHSMENENNLMGYINGFVIIFIFFLLFL